MPKTAKCFRVTCKAPSTLDRGECSTTYVTADNASEALTKFKAAATKRYAYDRPCMWRDPELYDVKPTEVIE